MHFPILLALTSTLTLTAFAVPTNRPENLNYIKFIGQKGNPDTFIQFTEYSKTVKVPKPTLAKSVYSDTINIKAYCKFWDKKGHSVAIKDQIQGQLVWPLTTPAVIHTLRCERPNNYYARRETEVHTAVEADPSVEAK